MQWKPMIEGAFGYNYMLTEKLVEMVNDSELNWKPTIGNNWMNMGQLLRHIGSACGSPVKGFVTGDWGFPSDMDPTKLSFEEIVPPVDKLLPVSSVKDAKDRLAEDKKTAYLYLGKCSEDDLDKKMIQAPWNPIDLPLGQRLMESALHLNQHKGQLFYYLKMQGKPVHTGHLWGM